MQFTTAIVSLLATVALASPTPRAASKSMAADTTEWTFTSVKRPCNTADTLCTWSFGINDGTTTTACAFNVTGSPADETNLDSPGATCGAYTITTGWSGQFGAGNGFTTLGVVNYAAKLLAYPAYTDAQLAGGATVTPDQSYPVYTLT